jgi:hypothetical protein
MAALLLLLPNTALLLLLLLSNAFAKDEGLAALRPHAGCTCTTTPDVLGKGSYCYNWVSIRCSMCPVSLSVL